MERIAFGPVSLYLSVVFKITACAEFCEVDELICRDREVEGLAEFHRPYRQWRPYVGGRQSIAQCMCAIVGPDIPIVIGLSCEIFPIFVVQKDYNFIEH